MCLTRVLLLAALTALLRIPAGCAEGLTADRLGVLYNLDEAGSRELAFMYASRRDVPKGNVFGVHLGVEVAASPDAFSMVRGQVLDELPTTVQSLLLVWTKPFAVGCMSITSAFASGYGTKFCEPKCGLTAANPLFDTDSWLPADTVGWWPAMLLPSADGELARRVIERGIASDGTVPPGIVYLVRTQDTARNVRAADYVSAEATLAGRCGQRTADHAHSAGPAGCHWIFHGSDIRGGAGADWFSSRGRCRSFDIVRWRSDRRRPDVDRELA